MADNENDIHVEVDVPAVEETPEPEVETPAVVVVETAPPEATPDGLLPVLLRIEERLTNLERNQAEIATVAVVAEASANEALANDTFIEAQVEEIREEVAEAAEEAQAPAEADTEPKKSHWLHR